ncbi:MAG: hypothetical protein L3K26_06170, partial [Candidatus Hydrogenedentes bacterium]|nr:hypothetical protein [Candidatus Hydrogenedentota bacterium]
LGGTWVYAQQSPTSPRPRPGIPNRNDNTNTGGFAQDNRNQGTSRFGGSGGRFGTDTKQPARVKQPAIRRDTQDDGRRATSTRAPRTTTGTPPGTTASPNGMVTGNNTALTPSNQGLPDTGQPTGIRQLAGNFDAILQREVEYPPLPAGGEVLMDLKGPMSVSEFMEDIQVATLWNVLISELVKTRSLDFLITEATPQQAMEILKFHDIYYEFDPKTAYLYVMSIEEWQEREFGDLEQHTFALEHTDGAQVQSIIQSLLSSQGKVISDPRTRHIYVWDTADNIALMEAAVDKADVPMNKHEFKVAFADFADVQAALSSMLSPNGSLLPDSRTGTLIVWDQPNILDRMGDALEVIDVPVASKTFYITHVLADDMIDYLEVMISERGIIQIDPRYNAVIVTDLPERLERVAEVLAVLDQELDTRTWVVDYADLDFLAEQIESKIPAEMGDIVVHEEVHQITVTGTPSRLDEIDALIKVWDIQRKQVQIEAFIVEVGSDVEREFNIHWSYFGSSDGRPIFADGGTGFNPDSGNLNVGQLPYSIPLYGALELDGAGQITRPIVTNTDGDNVISRIAGNNLAVTLEYLDKKNKATVLSSPRVAVQDGEEATFENATQVPFVSSTTFFNNSSINNFSNTNNTNRVEFIDVGTILRVLPRITTKNNILLDISAEDSTFIEVRVLASDQQSTVPQKTVRRAETQLRIQSGDTVVLGGLRRDRTGQTESRTPFLGDLPGIGRLFRYPNRKSEKNTLLIFITPTIVDEFTDPQATILAAAEETIAGDHRHNQKKLWGRIADTVSKRKNEISIAVGQGGDVHVEGERAALSDLAELFEEAPANVHVVLRHHPRSPEATITNIVELALEADRKIEFDKDLVPLIPHYRDPVATDAKAPALEPATPNES